MNELKQHVKASDVYIENGVLHISVDGEKYAISIALISKKLKGASETELNLFRLSPSGYGIHWPLIDEDLSFKGLIEGNFPYKKDD